MSDALTQYLVKKKWKKWFLVIGPKENDKFYAEALKNSAKKFNVKIKEEKPGILDQILEGRQEKKFLFLQKDRIMMFWLLLMKQENLENI